MSYYYENDPTQVKVNLQSAVNYLLSLHKNEYEWNLLGIKVIGVKEALPIPDGNYEYGDAYMIGNETDGYKLWIYTRADEAHAEDYWFNVGSFPKPGPQGPKGDGWGTAQLLQEGLTTNLTYDSTNGGKNESISSMTYVDSTTGKRVTKNFQMVSRLPIIPGKYVSMDATADNKSIKVKVDETDLALDFYKIKKSGSANVPAYSPTNGVITLPYSYQNAESSLIRRGLNGEAKFTYGIFERWNDLHTSGVLTFNQVNKQLGDGNGYVYISNTASDTGTMTADALYTLRHMPQMALVYNNQQYYRMDPASAPDGTLSYVHIDSLQDGEGGYKATGKSFTVNINTRSWQVVDLDFGGTGSSKTTHNLIINNSATGNGIYLSLVNNRPETYEGAPAGLWTSIDTAIIPCTVDSNGKFTAGLITTDGDNFKITHGEGQEILMTQDQISIVDNMA